LVGLASTSASTDQPSFGVIVSVPPVGNVAETDDTAELVREMARMTERPELKVVAAEATTEKGRLPGPPAGTYNVSMVDFSEIVTSSSASAGHAATMGMGFTLTNGGEVTVPGLVEPVELPEPVEPDELPEPVEPIEPPEPVEPEPVELPVLPDPPVTGFVPLVVTGAGAGVGVPTG
jgi:hypothetical protein